LTSRPFVSGLLLAAGTSSRLGRPKQLEELDGIALVSRAVGALGESDVDEVVVIVGQAADRVAERIDPGRVKVILNPGYERGLSSSLRLGVDSLDKRSEAVVVCLADQPFVTKELIDSIIERHLVTGADAVVAASGELVSPPVLLSRRLYGKIAALRGDRGAKAIALAEPSLERVEVGADTLLDVDTDQELARARELLKEMPSTARGPEGGRRARSRPSSGK
jgi:molybdenum cofactor cytidylyltransferase